MIVTVEPRRAGRGHLSLGTIILGGGGGVGVICVFLSVEPGRRGSFVSRNNYSKCRIREIGVIVSNDSKCRTREMGSLSLGRMIPSI